MDHIRALLEFEKYAFLLKKSGFDGKGTLKKLRNISKCFRWNAKLLNGKDILTADDRVKTALLL